MVDISFTGNEAYLTNTALFGGEKLYLLAKSVSFSYQNLTSFQPITKVNIQETGEAIGDLTNLERRKGQNTYNGYGGLNIQISGLIDLNNLGSLDTSYTITPGLIYTLLMNAHRRYYYYDGKVVKAWLENDPDHLNIVQTPYTNGIPVVIESVDMNTNDFDNIIEYSMTLREDKSSD